MGVTKKGLERRATERATVRDPSFSHRVMGDKKTNKQTKIKVMRPFKGRDGVKGY